MGEEEGEERWFGSRDERRKEEKRDGWGGEDEMGEEEKRRTKMIDGWTGASGQVQYEGTNSNSETLKWSFHGV